MGEDSKLGSKIKAQITRFSGQLGEGLGKVRRRLVSEMVYGIQAAEDVKVSEIARTLNERIELIKTEERLCRNLAGVDLTDPINRWTVWEGAAAVDEETVLAIDLGDVRKTYAKKMEYLGRVRDGSTGEIVPGYWVCEVLAARPDGEIVTPLYGELYAQKAEHFRSENDPILKAVDRVRAGTGKNGIWTIDRGGDRRNILIPLIERGLRFVVRQKGDRHVVLPGVGKRSVEAAALRCPTPHEMTVAVEREGHVEKKCLHLGSLPVRLPEQPDVELWLGVIRGLASHPIWLLTNVPPPKGRNHAEWIAEIYLTRWKCEEAYRFIKQSDHLEDVRVRSYTALRNVYALVHAVFYFVSVILATKSKLNLIFKKVCQKAKRFYEIAAFYHYAVADGIHRLLFASRTGPHPTPPQRPSGQLVLDFLKPHPV
jgi:hypothetical protein